MHTIVITRTVTVVSEPLVIAFRATILCCYHSCGCDSGGFRSSKILCLRRPCDSRFVTVARVVTATAAAVSLVGVAVAAVVFIVVLFRRIRAVVQIVHAFPAVSIESIVFTVP